MKKLSLLFYIINPNDKKYLKFLNKYKIKFKTIINATGTASSSLLEYFGLNEIDKVLIISIIPALASASEKMIAEQWERSIFLLK